MNIISKNDLIEMGYESGAVVTEMLEEVKRLERQGIKDRSYILRTIKKRFGESSPRMCMRKNPLPLREAIMAATEEEVDNLAKVRRKMSEVLRSPIIKDGAIMPDSCPTGSEEASMPVGGVVVAEGAIIPSAHSSDICCSMHATFYLSDLSISEQLDNLLEVTRFGAGGRSKADQVSHDILNEKVWGNSFLKGLRNQAEMYLADQGDGNHFAFIGEMSMGLEELRALEDAGYSDLAGVFKDCGREVQVLVTHHGSRGLGAQVYKKGQIVAEKQTAKKFDDVPDASAWLESESKEGREYWEALQYVSRWTKANHELIHERFLASIHSDKIAALGNEHNFVWKSGNDFVHGKGATPAWKDEEGRPLLGLIPLNMAEPILLVMGEGNEDYLSFAPHGAGRNLSRSALMRKFRKGHRELDRQAVDDEIKNSTRNIDLRWYSGKADLSETPVAYKSATEVRQQIESFRLAKVIGEIKPKGCIMAGVQKSWKEIRAEHLSPKQLRQIEHRSERRASRQSLKNGYD